MWNNDAGFTASYLESFPGYYETADAGYIDEDGYVWIMGRTDDIINVAGHRLSTGAMEEVLSAHPDVAEVVVVRHDEQLRGEVPRAVVVPRAGCSPSVRELRDHCRESLALYQVPRFIELWDDLPRTPAGKVDKRAVALSPLRD